MKSPDVIVLRSEFRKGTTKVFKNSEEKTISKQLADKTLVIEAARAAFFDVEGIDALKLTA